MGRTVRLTAACASGPVVTERRESVITMPVSGCNQAAFCERGSAELLRTRLCQMPVTPWRERRHRQSSARICVEHANAEYKQWRPLQRYASRRDTYATTG